MSVRVSDLLEAGAGKHRCTVSLFALPPVSVAAGALAPLAAVVNPTISLMDGDDDAFLQPHPEPSSADGPNTEIIGTLTFIYDLVLDIRNLPEGSPHTSLHILHDTNLCKYQLQFMSENEQNMQRLTQLDVCAGSEQSASEPSLPETEGTEPNPPPNVTASTPPLAGTAGPEWGTHASDQPATTDDVVLAVESHEDDVKRADDDSDDLSFCSEDSADDVMGVGMSPGPDMDSPEGDSNGNISGGGSPMLSRRLFKQGSLLGTSGTCTHCASM